VSTFLAGIGISARANQKFAQTTVSMVFASFVVKDIEQKTMSSAP
jgi:hypothetical protein